MTIAERLRKLSAKEDAADGTVSVGGLVSDLESLVERRFSSADQKQRDRDDDFDWIVAEWGGEW